MLLRGCDISDTVFRYCLGPCYWIIAFLVAAAVPNLNGIVSLIGALFMVSFNKYTGDCISF